MDPEGKRIYHRIDGRPLVWDYDGTEMLTDGIVHAIGIALALVGVVVLITTTWDLTQGLRTASIVIYALGLLTMWGFSAAYNMWPVSPKKWALRRFDQSAIFFFIAATYTRFIVQLNTNLLPFLLGVWSVAGLGIVLKLAMPGRFDRISIGLCLLLGWSGVMAYEPVTTALPRSTVLLIAADGLVYSGGVVFHVWDGLRFQNTIWHSLVLVAAVCHYMAIVDCFALART